MKILIIEDRPTHLQAIQAKLIRAGHDVYPKPDEREKLNEQIIACFEGGIDIFYVEEATNFIRTYIENLNPDLILVDYELKEDTIEVVGTAFIETFLEERNIIIVTGQMDSMLNNDIMECVKKPYAGTKRDVCFKDKNIGPQFLNLLLEKVKQFEDNDENKSVNW